MWVGVSLFISHHLIQKLNPDQAIFNCDKQAPLAEDVSLQKSSVCDRCDDPHHREHHISYLVSTSTRFDVCYRQGLSKEDRLARETYRAQ